MYPKFFKLCCYHLANKFRDSTMVSAIRTALLKKTGVKVVGNATFISPVSIYPISKAGNIKIDDGTYINSEVRFACADKIHIGKNVLIGPRVSLETMNHSLGLRKNGKRSNKPSPIVIKDNVWIGSGSIILPGVTINEGSVVAAGSVVTKDIPANSLCGGVPCKFLKNISI